MKRHCTDVLVGAVSSYQGLWLPGGQNWPQQSKATITLTVEPAGRRLTLSLIQSPSSGPGGCWAGGSWQLLEPRVLPLMSHFSELLEGPWGGGVTHLLS